jgi:hypothetical protein
MSLVVSAYPICEGGRVSEGRVCSGCWWQNGAELGVAALVVGSGSRSKPCVTLYKHQQTFWGM